MENFGVLSKGKPVLENHGLVVFCTEGMAQFDYDGRTIRLHKNDLFLYMAHSIAENFMASADFNCRQLWFSQSEMWDINIHSNTGLPDLVFLKNQPKVSLNETLADLFDSHFHLLCRMNVTSKYLSLHTHGDHQSEAKRHDHLLYHQRHQPATALHRHDHVADS